MRFLRCTANGDDRGSDRTVCSGIAATTRRRYGAASELVTSCPCWPCGAPSMAVVWAGGGGSWSAPFPGSPVPALARPLRQARRHPRSPLARLRADLLAVVAQDVEDGLRGCPFLPTRIARSRFPAVIASAVPTRASGVSSPDYQTVRRTRSNPICTTTAPV